VLVVVAMALVERQLGAELATELPDEAPTVFLVDVQPGQWPGVERELAAAGATDDDSVPVVMARVAAVDGRGVEELLAERRHRGARWALTREQRLTFLDRLPDDNRVISGKLWDDPEHAEVSVEEEFARDLGVGLGSTIGFDVQGVPHSF
jgi:putative ABC transport system permease protein